MAVLFRIEPGMVFETGDYRIGVQYTIGYVAYCQYYNPETGDYDGVLFGYPFATLTEHWDQVA